MVNKQDIINYGYTIISVAISIIYFFICYMMTLYIILQPEAQIDLFPSRSSKNHKYSAASSNGTSPSSKFASSSSSLPPSGPAIANRMSAYSQQSHSGNATPQLSREQSINLNTVRLNHIFRNEHTFKLFIRHLAKEYCIENALFLFESQQFKKQCNALENQLLMITRDSNVSKSATNDLSIKIPIDKDVNKAISRASNSKSMSNSRRCVYSKKAKNLLSGNIINK